MGSFNVRLTETDAEAIRILRAHGENISELCRRAIIEEANWLRRRSGGIRSVRKYFKELFLKYPEPEENADGPSETFEDHVNADHERIVRSYLDRHQPARRAG